MPISAQEALQRTIEHREIFHDEMLDLMRQILNGEISPVMTAAILTGLRVKKETIGEITAAAQILREMAVRVPRRPMQTCWTSWARAVMARRPSTFPAPAPLSARRRARKLPNMAGAASRPVRARQMCWKHWGRIWR